ncbi:MAG: GNAT family N-acetyltransferase [Anaerolineae bacterium]|nr:GNAT family N-acetyltransferase [Anaerolineae bacterium]
MNMETAAFRARPVRAGDESAVRDLRLEGLRLYPTAFGADYDEAAARPDGWWRDWVAEYLSATDMAAAFVAESEADGALIGMLTVRRNNSAKTRHAANVYAMYVREAWQGKGVASRLLESAAEWAKAHGVQMLKLSVEVDNIPAIRCYLRNGYTVYGVDPHVLIYDNANYDMLLMVRRL